MTPFVSRTINPDAIEGEAGEWSKPSKTYTGQEYLDEWKSQGGHDVPRSLPIERPMSTLIEEPRSIPNKKLRKQKKQKKQRISEQPPATTV